MNTPEIVSTARVVLRDENDQILMPIRALNSKHRPGDGDFFGGKKDKDKAETDAEAAAREVGEETGCDIKEDKLTFLYGVSEHDISDNVWYSRMYFSYEGRLAVADIKKMPEHLGLVCASKTTVLTLTDFVPHQQALNCLD